jgi:hypothetical protein
MICLRLGHVRPAIHTLASRHDAAAFAPLPKPAETANFSGTISGFAGQDQLDLTDITYSTNSTLGYSANSKNLGGSLTVSDGVHAAKFLIAGEPTVYRGFGRHLGIGTDGGPHFSDLSKFKAYSRIP